MNEYPKRPPHFAIRYLKALLNSDATRMAGRDAVLLTLFIVAREDSLYYSKAPAFWRAEVMRQLQIKSPKDIVRIRNRAIDAGILRGSV